MRHNQKNAHRWQALIQDQKSSGLTIRSWCDKNGINQSCFFIWKRRLLAKAEQEACFAEISLVNVSAVPVPTAAPFDAPVHIQYQDFEMEEQSGKGFQHGREYKVSLIKRMPALT